MDNEEQKETTEKLVVIPEVIYEQDDDEEALRRHLFAADFDDRPVLLVDVPEWHRQVLIKALSGTERMAFVHWNNGMAKDDPNYLRHLNFYLVSNFCLHPKTRKRFLKAGDEQTFMSERNGFVIDMLANTVTAFSHIDGTSMEQARKNLGRASSSAIISSPNGVAKEPLSIS
jgi:hypothetical protein